MAKSASEATAKVETIISGGQTGADQGALDAAIALGIPHGGWVPKGRLTEAGTLPDKYHLKEMTSASYPKRTEKNILESNGTLILTYGRLTGGSALTAKLAKTHQRPCLHIDLGALSINEAAERVRQWLASNLIETLNVAGSRASRAPNIHQATVEVLMLALSDLRK
jgi:hypothetical protein